MIEKWQEQVAKVDPDSMTSTDIRWAMQAEINELRAALAERDAEVAKMATPEQYHEIFAEVMESRIKLAAQRKVLGQALETLRYVGYVPRADGTHPVEQLFTAIQEVLK